MLQDWIVSLYGRGFTPPCPRIAARLLAEHPEWVRSDLYLACGAGEEERLRHHLAAAGPDWAGAPGGPLNMPPLCAVTFSGLNRLPEFAPALERCARLLLEAGADPNSGWLNPDYPDYRFSALYGAAGYNHAVPLTRLLLAAGADPNDNESLYHSFEAPGGDLTITRLLLDAGARVTGSNALFKVLDYDNLEGLRLLLAHGGDADELSGGLGRPLHHAIRRRRSLAHIDLLLAAGADPAAVNPEGLTPYRLALRRGLTEVAERLLALVPGEPPLSARERLVAACARAGAAEARAVLDEYPDLIASLSEAQLRTLPDLAAEGCMDAVRVMVEIGWPIDTPGGDWRASALNLAVFRGDVAMTRFLLAHGADWRARHGYHDNVIGTLSFASKAEPAPGGDWLGCAQALLEAGVPKPAPDSDYLFRDDIARLFGRVGNPDNPVR